MKRGAVRESGSACQIVGFDVLFVIQYGIKVCHALIHSNAVLLSSVHTPSHLLPQWCVKVQQCGGQKSNPFSVLSVYLQCLILFFPPIGILLVHKFDPHTLFAQM